MRILSVLYDNSLSQAAVEMGADLIQQDCLPLTILAVVSNTQLRPKYNQLLDAARKMAEPRKLTLVLRFGDPLKEIVAETRTGRFELVILGEEAPHKAIPPAHGKNISLTLINQIGIPVLFVKGGKRDLNRILLCNSGGDTTGVLSRFTRKFSRCLHKDPQITILHVMSQISSSPRATDWPLLAGAEKLMLEQTPEGIVLERDLRVLEQQEYPVTPKIRHGFVIDEILSEVQEGDYDLLVIGAHRKEMWQRLLLEDIAFDLLRQADRPVLVVK